MLISTIDELLTAEQILTRKNPDCGSLAGIYFLIDTGTIVYVGQSTNVARRVAQHFYSHSKRFDRFWFFPCSPENLVSLENRYICLLTPKYNLKPGRPKGTGTGRTGRRIELYLSEQVIERLDAIGDGNKSLGVQRAIEAMK